MIRGESFLDIVRNALAMTITVNAVFVGNKYALHVNNNMIQL